MVAAEMSGLATENPQQNVGLRFDPLLVTNFSFLSIPLWAVLENTPQPTCNLMYKQDITILCLVLIFRLLCLYVYRSRETANMEYIKNIVHHYMCTNSTGRQQMIPALATALHFSPEEVYRKRITDQFVTTLCSSEYNVVGTVYFHLFSNTILVSLCY